ncbi:MAG: alpha-ketoglutarate-dependent dioxygenase AlkB [Aliivibrio sp.]|uniref:alpha-ketoglutarate-dependent dioxygenase AlkB family protein n=1 Tax=Aliivibrio sp. TaxID=1872443 RepID=UPI001A517D36|nr:alpha-ketoglutarate-dependent dioxygenase AlkB [Aliivibrio sp.]
MDGTNHHQIGLFDELLDQPINILPRDGCVNYYGQLINAHDTQYYFDTLMSSVEWRHDEAIIYGKHIITKRKVAWYGDEAFNYTYSNTTKSALSWTKELLALKSLVELETGERYNSCLLNLYHDGSEGMAWHSDAETALKKNGAIASLSFGAERKFAFKHKVSDEVVSLQLASGSLLVMKGVTQSHWLHRLPPTTTVSTPRVNLTFRTIVI